MTPSRSAIGFVVVVLPLGACSLPTFALDGSDPGLVPDRVVAVFRDGAPGEDTVWPRGLVPIASDPELRYVAFRVAPGGVERAISSLASFPGVESAYQARRAYPLEALPNDPKYPEQWGPQGIGLPVAWELTVGGHEVTIAVLDTGSDYLHPDLLSNLGCAVDANMIEPGRVPQDDYGHGTHVAGIVAASWNNALGVAGTSGSCIMTVRVLDAARTATMETVASGVRHAVLHGADIISMSLGSSHGDPVLEEAIRQAVEAGVLVVAAAGNEYCGVLHVQTDGSGGVGFDPRDTVVYPARYPGVLAVAALTQEDAPASFSSCGPSVGIAAPGVDIVSTYWQPGPPPYACYGRGSIVEFAEACTDVYLRFAADKLEGRTPPQNPGSSTYGYASGTSMAAPFVSGVAGLMKSWNPAVTGPQMRCILLETATDLGAEGFDVHTGRGRLDAIRGVQAARNPESVGC